jgi:hypothetical protein
MRQKRKQAGFGLKYVVHGVIKKYLDSKCDRNGIPPFAGDDVLVLIEAASRNDFFIQQRAGGFTYRDFGRLYYRHPDECLDLVRIIREEIAKQQDTCAGRIRMFLATHASTLTDDELVAHLNRKFRVKHFTRYQVETARQEFVDELNGLARWETPDMVRRFRDGVKPVSRKSKQSK